MKTAVMGHVLLHQEQLDLFEPLAKAGHRLVRGTAEPAKLMRQERAGEADVEPPAADRVEHADLACEL